MTYDIALPTIKLRDFRVSLSCIDMIWGEWLVWHWCIFNKHTLIRSK